MLTPAMGPRVTQSAMHRPKSDSRAQAATSFSVFQPGSAPWPAASVVISLKLANLQPVSPNHTILNLSDPHACALTRRGRRCTAHALVAIGVDTFAFGFYAEPNGRGRIIDRSDVVATIKPQAPSSVRVSLGGTIAKLATTSPVLSFPNDGRVYSGKLPFYGLDKSGQTIIGPGAFTAPVTLVVTYDPNKALSLPLGSFASPTALSKATLNYDSRRNLSSGLVSASASSALGAAVAVNPLSYSPKGRIALIAGTPTVSASISLQETNYADAFKVAGSKPGVAVTCVPSNCVPPAPGSQVYIRLAPTTRASNEIAVSDIYGTTLTFPYVVSSSQTFTFGSNANPFFAESATVAGSNLWFLVTPLACAIGQSCPDGEFAEVSTSGILLHSFPLPMSVNVSEDGNPDAVTGPDGAIWFPDGSSNLALYPVAIDRVTMAGQVTRYPLPKVSSSEFPYQITLGPDAAMWFTIAGTGGRGYIGRITAAGTISTFDPGSYAPAGSNRIVTGPNGSLWFGALTARAPYGKLEIESITPLGQISRVYTFPSGFEAMSPFITAAGKMWFVLIAAASPPTPTVVCSLSSAGGLSCNPLPGDAAGITAVAAATIGPDGAIWMTATNRSARTSQTVPLLLRTDPNTAASTTYALATGKKDTPNVGGIVTGPDGALWVGFPRSNSVLRFLP
jgi:virginiamycin B lyase